MKLSIQKTVPQTIKKLITFVVTVTVSLRIMTSSSSPSLIKEEKGAAD